MAPTGRVPVLVDDGLVVWDTLAIAEYLADDSASTRYGRAAHRAGPRAQSVRRMHSGFSELRNACPQNIEASLPEIGRRVLHEQAAVSSDLQRLQAMWRDALQDSSGPFLFGAFGIADAYFAPAAGRIRTYALSVDPAAQGYVDRARQPRRRSLCSRCDGERDFVAFDEPYRTSRDD